MLNIDINLLDPPLPAQQKIYLDKLKSDLVYFNEDRILLIRSYLDKAGFYSNLISFFYHIRDRLKNKNDIKLYNQFNKAKLELIHYIHQKNLRLKDNIKKPRGQMNEHIQDVLFSCKTILKYQFEEGFSMIKSDLESLLEQMHKKYIPQLKQEIANRNSLIHELDIQLIELKKALEQPYDPQVLRVILEIQGQLKYEPFSL